MPVTEETKERRAEGRRLRAAERRAELDAQPPVGYTIQEWTRQLKRSVPWYHTLDKDSAPETVKLGRSVLILESPRDYLLRMKARGGATTTRTNSLERAAA